MKSNNSSSTYHVDLCVSRAHSCSLLVSATAAARALEVVVGSKAIELETNCSASRSTLLDFSLPRSDARRPTRGPPVKDRAGLGRRPQSTRRQMRRDRCHVEQILGSHARRLPIHLEIDQLFTIGATEAQLRPEACFPTLRPMFPSRAARGSARRPTRHSRVNLGGPSLDR